MEYYIETDRLILRELQPSDCNGMFELDSNPEVHKYLGNKPIKKIEETIKVIDFVRQQYIDNGIGRWAAIEKSSGEFIGWTGLKLVKDSINNHTNFYDVGYRLIPRYWGKGYATESAIAAIKYGFEEIKMNAIYGITHFENTVSRKALEKAGLKYVENFEHDNLLCEWFKIAEQDWIKDKI